jgi:hypothetical protein
MVCDGVEGQLPDRVAPGDRGRFVDASSVDGRRCLTVRFDADPPAIQTGRWLQPREVQLDADGSGALPDGVVPRPPHEPRTVQCPSCASPLPVVAESIRLRVCPACGSQVALDDAEARVVGQGPGRAPDFSLPLGHPYTHRGERYEVIARLHQVEADDPADVGDHYLLYNPRLGTLWLDEYEGRWTLTRTTHVAPTTPGWPPPQHLETGDGRHWSAPDRGELRLAYVDGALPWLAQVGDRVRYAEYSGGRSTYEIVDEGGELTYAIGEGVPTSAVGAPARPGSPSPRGPQGASTALSWCVGGLVLLGLAGITYLSTSRGSQVLEARVAPEEISVGVSTETFSTRAGDVLAIEVTAPELQDAWEAVDLAIVDGEERAVHTLDFDLSYYSGVEGGESWSEGQRADTQWLLAPRDGDWHLYLVAVSGRGEAESATQSTQPTLVRVRRGGHPPLGMWGALIVGGVGALLGGLLAWQERSRGAAFTLRAPLLYTAVYVLSLAATWLNLGAGRVDEPEGVSIRDESARRTLFNPGRSHPEGGLSGGK